MSGSPLGAPPRRMTEAQWDVMRVCWRHGRPTAPEILEVSTRYGCCRDDDTYKVFYKTVHVLLQRLAEKGCVRIDRTYRYNQYIPLIDHHEALRAETECFLREIVGSGTEEIEVVIEYLERARERRDVRQAAPAGRAGAP